MSQPIVSSAVIGAVIEAAGAVTAFSGLSGGLAALAAWADNDPNIDRAIALGTAFGMVPGSVAGGIVFAAALHHPSAIWGG